ncbi:PREDICTED: rab11 family-interacting protein 4B-like isoform X2 [Priapulus caudatus]|uniref:Rab11 family-interacting protein 4B-like isoform X2 n=1 Tax=Priapulus caudatus TaxID=37621 RepID=A0ABM1FAI2_PRICU|nr:PREDICTED: rab11 family-interacting protein 4B-like isoform X2 [Priapulus caudatus]
MEIQEEYVDHLRVVFELCDVHKEGIISVEQFENVAAPFFCDNVGESNEDYDEALITVVQLLDPTDSGFITFDTFCEGVCHLILQDSDVVNTEPEDVDEEDELKDGDAFRKDNLDILVDEDIRKTCFSQRCSSRLMCKDEKDDNSNQPVDAYRNVSRCAHRHAMNGHDDAVQHGHDDSATYVDDIEKIFGHTARTGDGSGRDEETDSAFMSSSTPGNESPRARDLMDFHDERLNRPDSEVTDEEQYEDYGENEESLTEAEYDSHTSLSLFDGDLTHIRPHNSNGPDELYRRPPHARKESWIRRKRLSSGPTKARISSNAQASQLYRGANSSTHSNRSYGSSSRRSSTSDEMFAEEIAEDVHDLNSKVTQLQKTVAMLADSQSHTEDMKSRLKQENAALQARVHMLEEQVRDAEIKGEKLCTEEERRFRDQVHRIEREKNQEIENLQYRLQSLENEYGELKDSLPQLRQQLDRVKQEKYTLADQLSECEFNLSNLQEEHKRVQERCHMQQRDRDASDQAHMQLVEDMRTELDELRTSKMAGLRGSHLEAARRIMDLEAQVKHLKNENKSLRESNEDIQLQFLNHGLEEGHKLLGVTSPPSLAAELAKLSRDELQDKLKEQEDINRRLHAYIDSILVRIIENNPALLEVQQLPS